MKTLIIGIVKTMKQTIFRGNLVIFYLNNPSESFAGGIAILNPVIEESYGRQFVVGTTPPNTKDWSAGLRVVVLLDQVAHFLEFKDEHEFMERNALAETGNMTPGATSLS